MKILYGTTNKGKLQAMEKSVKPLNIELIGLNDLNCELPSINENGRTPLENAEIKARAYYEAFHMPVFSCDSGLYFDELDEEEQPGQVWICQLPRSLLSWGQSHIQNVLKGFRLILCQ